MPQLQQYYIHTCFALLWGNVPLPRHWRARLFLWWLFVVLVKRDKMKTFVLAAIVLVALVAPAFASDVLPSSPLRDFLRSGADALPCR